VALASWELASSFCDGFIHTYDICYQNPATWTCVPKMTTNSQVPDDAVKYILLQRTDYLRFPITPLYRHVLRRLPFNLPVYNVVATLEAQLRRTAIKTLYVADMQAEFATIAEYLPDTCSRVLDIGCGVAGIDVLIDRHFADCSADLHLLDKSHVERSVFYMFHERAAFHNSLEIARLLLASNGIQRDRIHLHEASGDNDIDVPEEFDLVISLLAWGFHFPVETYINRVAETLNDQGVVILDVRKGTNGMRVLQEHFGQIKCIKDSEKFTRIAARLAKR
jgi:SAM-dependent methyltransferase